MNDKERVLLTARPMKKPGQLKCTLDLTRLLPTKAERARFEENWLSFCKSDPSNPDIYELRGNRLTYLTEQVIPQEADKRPPLLLVFGNPASHSITAGMFFSPKVDGKENRFWKYLLPRARILDLAFEETLATKERNKRRMERMMALKYASPFRIGLSVFISMPSSAGGSWSGVAGVRKLVGTKALRRLESSERERVLDRAKEFLTPDGAVVAFQKNAWDGLRSDGDPEYSLELARTGKLKGTLSGIPGIPLFGVPPTRVIGPSSAILCQVLSEQGYRLLPKDGSRGRRKATGSGSASA